MANSTKCEHYASLDKNVRNLRSFITKNSQIIFNDKPDPLIRAARITSWIDASGTRRSGAGVFSYMDTIAVSALVRAGFEPSLAAATVGLNYAVAVETNMLRATLPMSYGAANWEIIDAVETQDGTQYAIYMDPSCGWPIGSFDCWALKNGLPVDVGAQGYEPTKHTLKTRSPYRWFANRKAA